MNSETCERLKASLEKALVFLENSRNPDGLWSDFLTLAGESVYWVSGYVGYTIIRYARKPKPESMLNEAGYRILAGQRADGGWSYGPGVPSDADSTSWCLRYLKELGIQSEESREKALSFLFRHQNQTDGGFRTYARPNDVARYMMVDGDVSFEGWSSSQMCVTAVALLALMENGQATGIGDGINYVRKGQETEGYWNPYWWTGKLYGTVNCMEALKTRGDNDYIHFLSNAQNWIARTQLEDGGWSDSPKQERSWPFSTALALKGLMLIPEKRLSRKVEEAAYWLLENQLSDGSWNCNHILRIPHPSAMEPWNQTYWKGDGRAINAVIKDHRRLYTTATAFAALSMFENTISKGDE